MFNSNSQIVALFSVIKSCSWVNFLLRMPSGGEYHLISRDWGTNQIAWKALFTCVVYTKLGYPLIARPRAVNCGMENGCGAPVPEFLTIRFCPRPFSSLVVCSSSFVRRTWVWDSGGVLLAHRAWRLAPVSRSHTVTSLLPWTADTTHDCSVGCVTRRRTRAPVDEKVRGGVRFAFAPPPVFIDGTACYADERKKMCEGGGERRKKCVSSSPYPSHKFLLSPQFSRGRKSKSIVVCAG